MLIQRVAFLSDFHYPYESKEAIGLTLDLLGELNPNVVIFGGDVVDFYPISSFLRDPARRAQLQSDLDHAAAGVMRFRKALPKARFLFKEGNHCLRLQKYLWSTAPELAGLRALKLPELLRFDRAGVERFIKNRDRYHIGRLYYLHGNEFRLGTVHPARAMLLRTHVNSLFGHVHKFDHFSVKDLAGNSHASWSNGCLCDLLPEYDVMPNWTNGFTYVDYVDDGLFSVEPVRFFSHRGRLKVIQGGELKG